MDAETVWWDSRGYPGPCFGSRHWGDLMTRRRPFSLLAAALVASAALGAYGASAAPLGASAAPPVEADATAVTHWNQIAAATLAALPGPNGGAPPAF